MEKISCNSCGQTLTESEFGMCDDCQERNYEYLNESEDLS